MFSGGFSVHVCINSSVFLCSMTFHDHVANRQAASETTATDKCSTSKPGIAYLVSLRCHQLHPLEGRMRIGILNHEFFNWAFNCFSLRISSCTFPYVLHIYLTSFNGNCAPSLSRLMEFVWNIVVRTWPGAYGLLRSWNHRIRISNIKNLNYCSFKGVPNINLTSRCSKNKSSS